MAQRGRKSAAALNVLSLTTTVTRSRPTAPEALTNPEVSLFTQTALANPHLSAGDSALLGAYCVAVAKSFELARQADVTAWEKSLKLVLALSRALRISPRSSHPVTVGRRKSEAAPTVCEQLVDEFDDAG